MHSRRNSAASIASSHLGEEHLAIEDAWLPLLEDWRDYMYQMADPSRQADALYSLIRDCVDYYLSHIEVEEDAFRTSVHLKLSNVLRVVAQTRAIKCGPIIHDPSKTSNSGVFTSEYRSEMKNIRQLGGVRYYPIQQLFIRVGSVEKIKLATYSDHDEFYKKNHSESWSKDNAGLIKAIKDVQQQRESQGAVGVQKDKSFSEKLSNAFKRITLSDKPPIISCKYQYTMQGNIFLAAPNSENVLTSDRSSEKRFEQCIINIWLLAEGVRFPAMIMYNLIALHIILNDELRSTVKSRIGLEDLIKNTVPSAVEGSSAEQNYLDLRLENTVTTQVKPRIIKVLQDLLAIHELPVAIQVIFYYLRKIMPDYDAGTMRQFNKKRKIPSGFAN